jgi:hypothetical protein
MYEHLTQILRYLFDYSPKEPHKIFRELSKQRNKPESTLSINNSTEIYLFAQRQLAILSV